LHYSFGNCSIYFRDQNIKKLAGFDMYYRIRVGDYRIGVKLEKDIVYFVVVEHRKDVYKTFP
jgi:mRNA interferase RelE/StbE